MPQAQYKGLLLLLGFAIGLLLRCELNLPWRQARWAALPFPARH
jgi:hypothetical protein